MTATKYHADPTLVANLRRLMRDRCMRPSDVCKVACASGVHIHRVTVYYTISGKHSPTLHTLRAIRTALGCTWDELLEPRRTWDEKSEEE